MRRRRQFTPLMKLAVEANGVIALRIMKLMLGGKSSRREAELMVSEKLHAAFEAGASLLTGASGNDIIHRCIDSMWHEMRNGGQEKQAAKETISFPASRPHQSDGELAWSAMF
jgi:hypothetical protein